MSLLPQREQAALAARRGALVAELKRCSRRLGRQAAHTAREHPVATAGAVLGAAVVPPLASRALGPLARPLRRTAGLVWPFARALTIGALVR